MNLRYVIRNGEKVLQEAKHVRKPEKTPQEAWEMPLSEYYKWSDSGKTIWQDKTDIPTVKEEDNEGER